MDLMEFSSFVRPPSLPTFSHNGYLECAPDFNLGGQVLPFDYIQCGPCSFNDMEDLDLLDSISSEDCAALLPIIRIAFPSLQCVLSNPFITQHKAHSEAGMHVGALHREVIPSISGVKMAQSIYVNEKPQILSVTLPSTSPVMHSPRVSMDDPRRIPMTSIKDDLLSMHSPFMMLHNPCVAMDESQQLMRGTFVPKGENSTISLNGSPQKRLIKHLNSGGYMDNNHSFFMDSPKQLAKITHLSKPSLINLMLQDGNPFMSAKAYDPSMRGEAQVCDASALADVPNKQFGRMVQLSNASMTDFVFEDGKAAVGDPKGDIFCKFDPVAVNVDKDNASKENYMDKEEDHDSEKFKHIEMFTSVGDASKMDTSTNEFKENVTNMRINTSFSHLNAPEHHYTSTACPSTCAMPLEKGQFSLIDACRPAMMSLHMGKPLLDGRTDSNFEKMVLCKEGNTSAWMDEYRQTAGLGFEMENSYLAVDELVHQQSTDLFGLKEEPTQENGLLQKGYLSDELYKESALKALQNNLRPVSPTPAEGYRSASKELGGWHPGDLWARMVEAPAKEDITRLLPDPEPMASLFLDDKFLHSIAVGTSGIPYSFLPSLACVSSDTSTTSGQVYEPSELFHEVHFDGSCIGSVYAPSENECSIDGILRTSSDENTTTGCNPSETPRFIHVQEGQVEPLAGESDILAELLHPNVPYSNDIDLFLDMETLRHNNDGHGSEIFRDQAFPGASKCEEGTDCGTITLTEVLCNRRKAIIKALRSVRKQEAKQHENVTTGPSKQRVTLSKARCKELPVSGHALHIVAESTQTDSSLPTASCLKRNRRAMSGELVCKKQRVMGNEMHRVAKFVHTASSLSAALSFIVLEGGMHGVSVHEALNKLLKQGHANLFDSIQPRATQVKVALRECTDIKEVQGCRFIWRSFETDEKGEIKDASSASHKHGTQPARYNLPERPSVDSAQEIQSAPEQLSFLDVAGSSGDAVRSVNEPNSRDCHKTRQRHLKLPEGASNGLYYCRQHDWSQNKLRVTHQLPRKLDIELVNHQTPEECENNDARNDGHQIKKHREEREFLLRACRSRRASEGCANQMTDDVSSSFVSSKNIHNHLQKEDGTQHPCTGDDININLLSGRDQLPVDSPLAGIPNHMTGISDMGKESQTLADSSSKNILEHAEVRGPKLGHCHKNVGVHWQCARQRVPDSAYCEQHARWCKRERLKAPGGTRLFAAAANCRHELLFSGACTSVGLGEHISKGTSSNMDEGQETMSWQHGCKKRENPKERNKAASMPKLMGIGETEQDVQGEASQMGTFVCTRNAGRREKGNTHWYGHSRSQKILKKSTRGSHSTETRGLKQTKKLSSLQQNSMPLTVEHIQEHDLAAKELEGKPRMDGKPRQCTLRPASGVVGNRQQKFVLQTTLMNRAAPSHVEGFSRKGKRSSSTRRGQVNAKKQEAHMPHVLPPNLDIQDAKLCSKTDGRSWHCSQYAKLGFKYCEHHLPTKKKKKSRRSSHV